MPKKKTILSKWPNMQKIEYKGESGYFITESQKQMLDKVIKPLLSRKTCGGDCNGEKL